ncbi:fungal specific transcription factor domain-containing protein [Aspergillus puulaauensis]|uniref:Xylanolytic transcriptional activator regulatory domain-containing protein n=1 Tax=Aspergillus puulaauensis TaxID=1220207 RepID=A0A7R7XU40_9EURO|nr:uncharacterized protein APUU_60788A [Aspergillus puulaauensis]BCS27740.1 hypothetical protein APUU_60788A [Aspergillus puulaauensis]
MLLIEDPPIEVASPDASDSGSEYNTVCNPLSRIAVDRLCDEPLFQVPCKPWTITTDDDHLISSLISLYFTWHHPLMQVVDQEMFLREMSAGDLASEFCSPVLVNSILAVASIYSDYAETYAVPGDATSRGQNFFREAEGRWRAEEGRPSLANIQALALMSHNLNLQGKDNSSWLHLRQAVQLGQDIGIFESPPSPYCEWDRMPDHVKRTSAKTGWAIFILNSDMCLEHGRMPNMSTPRLSRDKIDDVEEDSVWVPYYAFSDGIDFPKKPSFLHYVFAGLAELAKTLVDIQNLFFGRAPDISIHEIWAEASPLYDRVEAFRKSLQDPAVLDDQPAPQMIFLHIKCHHIAISLLGLVLEQQDSKPSLDSVIIEELKLNRIHAVKQIALYLRLYSKHYGLPQTPSLFFSPIKTCLVALLASLDTISTEIISSELHQMLLSFGGRFPAAREVIHQIDAVQFNI